MSSRREVLIRILALLQKKPLIKSKKSHIKMLKTALFDCAINKKCCSVDGGRGICPLFSSPPRGIWQLKSPHPREFAIQGQKNANARGSVRGGGLGAGGIDWCIKHVNFFFTVSSLAGCISLGFTNIKYCKNGRMNESRWKRTPPKKQRLII